VTYLYTFWVALLIVTIPSNLFLKWGVDAAYVDGLLVDYLIPKLYLSDLVVVALLGTWFIERFVTWFKAPRLARSINRTIALFFAGIGLIGIGQLFSSHYLISALQLTKLLILLVLITFFLSKKLSLNQRWLYWSVLISVSFQSVVALTQFYLQRAVYGYLFFGEPQLEKSLGIAKTVWLGREVLLPYGTTAHPNVLGGYLALGILGLLYLQPPHLRRQPLLLSLVGTVMVLTLIALLLTQSISAWLTLAIGLLVLFWRQRGPLNVPVTFGAVTFIVGLFLIPLLLSITANYFPGNLSLTRRAKLNQAGLQMFLAQPVTGVGLGTFTAHVEDFSDSSEVVRFVQPAHHLGLLWLAETGLLGLGSLLLLIGVGFQKRALLGQSQTKVVWLVLTLLPIVALDHYGLTLAPALWLAGIALLQVSLDQSQ
jgi:O-antigen ligase